MKKVVFFLAMLIYPLISFAQINYQLEIEKMI